MDCPVAGCLSQDAAGRALHKRVSNGQIARPARTPPMLHDCLRLQSANECSTAQSGYPWE